MLESADGVGGEPGDVLGHLAGKPPEEALGQDRDVLASIAQRRQLDPNDVQAVVQVLAEATRSDVVFHISVGCRQHAHVDGDLLRRAYSAHLLLLENPQKLHLKARRQLTHLVEQNGATARVTEDASTLGRRSGERALLVTE